MSFLQKCRNHQKIIIFGFGISILSLINTVPKFHRNIRFTTYDDPELKTGVYSLDSEPFRSDDSSSLEFDFTLAKHKGIHNQWQPVNGTEHKFYVYSAYYDARNKSNPFIRVIGKYTLL